MFQSERVVLKRCVQIGLRGMAGVARLGEQAQVGKAELPYQFDCGLGCGCFLPQMAASMEHAANEDSNYQRQQCQNRFARTNRATPDVVEL